MTRPGLEPMTYRLWGRRSTTGPLLRWSHFDAPKKALQRPCMASTTYWKSFVLSSVYGTSPAKCFSSTQMWNQKFSRDILQKILALKCILKTLKVKEPLQCPRRYQFINLEYFIQFNFQYYTNLIWCLYFDWNHAVNICSYFMFWRQNSKAQTDHVAGGIDLEEQTCLYPSLEGEIGSRKHENSGG